MPSLRVAVVVGSFPSTSETFVVGQIAGLLERGHDVSILAHHENRQGVEHDVSSRHALQTRVTYCTVERSRLRRITGAVSGIARHFPRHPGRILESLNIFRHRRRALDLTRLSQCVYWLDNGPRDFDVVYCHFGPNGSHAEWLRRQGHITGKIVTVFHAYDLTKFVIENGARTYQRLFSTGDLFLAITSYARRKLIELGCAEDRIAVHHMGVDCRCFAFEERTLARDQPIRLLCVGRLVEKKGFEFAIRAFAHVAERGLPFEATIVGGGDLAASLRTTVIDLGLEDRVTFVGWQTQAEVTRLVRHAHAMLVPSVTAGDGDEEGLPVVLMEALASGLPAITTRHAGIPELIEDARTGLLVEERDSPAIAEKIVFLIENYASARAMACEGRKRIETEFNVDRLNDSLAKIMESVTGPSNDDSM